MTKKYLGAISVYDAHIKVIGAIEPKICMKLAQNCLDILIENLGAKFPSTTLGYFVVRISLLDNTLKQIF